MTDVFLTFFGFSLTISAIIFLLILLNRLLGDRFMARSRYIIWTIVIIRLCLPFIGSLTPKLFSFSFTLPEENYISIDRTFSGTTDDKAPIWEETETSDIVAENSNISEGVSAVDISDSYQTDSGNTSVSPDAFYRTEIKKSGISLREIQIIAVILYFFCTFTYLISKVLPYYLYQKKLKKAVFTPNDEILEVYIEICKKLNIRRMPEIYITNDIPGPMLCGYFKRAVVLPDIAFEKNDLKNVLTHELIHHKRGDLWIKLLSVFACSLNFFNPLVYIAAKQTEKEMELSCDELVLKNADSEERLAYGAFMLEIIRKRKFSSSALTTFYSPKQSTVKERFINILNEKTRKHGKIIILTVLILCVTAGSIFGCEAIRKLSGNNLFIKGDRITLTALNVDFPVISFERSSNISLKRYTPNDTTVSAFLDANDIFILCEQTPSGEKYYFELIHESKGVSSCIYCGTTEKLEFSGADFSRFFGKKGFYFEFDGKKIFFADDENSIPYPYFRTLSKVIGPVDIDSDGECEIVMNGELYTTLHGKPVKYNVNETVAKHYSLSNSDLTMVFPYSSYYYVYGLSYDGDIQSDGSYTKYTAKLSYSGGSLTVEPTEEEYVNDNKEYKTDNRNWKLYYSMNFNALVLENGEKCFGFNPNTDNISPTFDGKKITASTFGDDYSASIFEKQNKAAIMVRDSESIRISFIDLSSGKVIQSVTHNPNEILSLHGVSKYVLANYRKTNFGDLNFSGNYDKFFFDATVRESDRELIAEFSLRTFDGRIHLVGTHTLRTHNNVFAKYKATKTNISNIVDIPNITSLEYSFKPQNFDIKVYDFKTSPSSLAIFTSDLNGKYYIRSHFDQLPDEDYVYSEVINFGECENGTLLFALVDANYYDKEDQIYARRYFLYIANPESMFDTEGVPSNPLRWIYKCEIDINDPTSREWTHRNYSGGRFVEQSLKN